jgi:uncharacterized membrane protein
MFRSATWLPRVLFILSLVGIADATYLSITHYFSSSQALLFCDPVTGGCSTVLSSPWAVQFGVPLVLLGMGYYIIVAIFSFFYAWRGRELALRVVLGLTTVGFFFSMWLVYLQFGVIGSICWYCLLSALTSTLLFFSSITLVFFHDPHLTTGSAETGTTGSGNSSQALS